MSAGESMGYRSPIRKLLRFFQRSRDRWKEKCKAAKRENKSLKTWVRGKVTYLGKPVSQGTITFHPAAPPGEYVVVIESYEGGPTAEEPDCPRNWLIPQRYGNPATSGLTATIPADASGRLQFDFDLD